MLDALPVLDKARSHRLGALYGDVHNSLHSSPRSRATSARKSPMSRSTVVKA